MCLACDMMQAEADYAEELERLAAEEAKREAEAQTNAKTEAPAEEVPA